MSKKKTVSTLALGTLFVLLIGGGFFIFNRNGGSKSDEMIKMAAVYVEKNEFEKALGILEALLITEPNNKELSRLVLKVKEQDIIYADSRISEQIKADEKRLTNKINKLLSSTESALLNNHTRVAELLKDEILRLDPDNSAVKALEKKIETQIKEDELREKNLFSLAEDIKKAIKDGDADILKENNTLFHDELSAVLDSDLVEDVKTLKEELDRIDPQNVISKEVENSLSSIEESTRVIKEELESFNDDISEIIDGEKKQSLEEKLANIKESESLTDKAKEALLEDDSDNALSLLDQALKLDSENDVAKKLSDLLKSDATSINEVIQAEELLTEAKSKLKDGKIDEVKELLEEAFLLDPENSEIEELKDLVSSDSEVLENRIKADDLVEQAKDSISTQNIDKASKLLDEALLLDPENSKANKIKSLLEEDTVENSKELDRKLEDVLKAQELLDEAETAIIKKDFDKASELIDESKILDPENSKAERLKSILKSVESGVTNLDDNVQISDDIEKNSAASDLDNTDLDDTDLVDTDLVDTDIVDSDIDDTDIDDTDLDDTDLDDTDLDDTDLVDTDTDTDISPNSNDTQTVAVLEQADTGPTLDELKQVDTGPTLDELKSQANLLGKNSQYEKQLDILDQISEREPSAAFYVKAGIASYKLTQYNEAVNYFKQAISLDSSYAGIYYPMALSYEKLADEDLRGEMLNMGLELRPEHGATNYELGRFYTAEGLYLEALELFLNAQKINDKSIKYQLGVALAYYNLKEYEKSIGIYENINGQNSGISEVHYNLSMARLKVGALENALNDISKAIELKPDNPVYLYTKGEISEGLGSIEDAAYYYVEALKLDFTYYKPMLNLGNIYDKLGRYQDSVTLLEKALVLNPEDQNAQFSLGTAYLHNKEYIKSITLLKQTHLSDPESTLKLYTLSLAYTEIGDIKAAEDGFNEVISMDSIFYDAYFYLGQLLYAADRIEEARTFFNKVLELNPDYRFKEQILALP